MVPARATTPIFHGISAYNRAGVCNLSLQFGAKGDDTTDDTAALNSAITAWQNGTCNTIVLDSGKVYLIDGAVYLGGSNTYQRPLRITSDGPTWTGYWNNIDASSNGTGALDLRYDGTDGVHLAKIDTRQSGILEIDHVTLEDLGTDSLPFIATTNTTVHIHDNAFIGNPGHSGQTSNQDAIILGQNGYTASSASITSGTATLTIGAGDPPFNSSMVGWQVGIPGAGSAGAFFSTTIKTFVSPTQVTLNANASTTVTNGTAYYFGISNDKAAPFQGYGTVISRNFYSRIRHGVTFNEYANAIEVDNETYSTTCGSGEANGAPYVMTGVPGFIDGALGDIIRGGTVEVPNYKHVVEMLNGDGDSLFDGIGVWDANGYFSSVVYVAGASNGVAPGYSTLIGLYTNMTPITYTSGSGASTMTVVAGEYNATPANFPNGITIPKLSVNSGYAPQSGDAGFARSSSTGYMFFGSDHTVGASIGFDGTNYDFTNPGLGANTVQITAQYGNIVANGVVQAKTHNACSATSNIPCEITITCAISAATSCGGSVAVPASSVCSGTPNVSDTTTNWERLSWGTLSGTTQPFTVTVGASQTSTAAFNVTCL